LFEVGKSQSRNARWPEAIYWLEKSHDVISGQQTWELSSDAKELQIGIWHELARAFLNQGGEESQVKVWDIIHRLDVECGGRLVVLLLKLDAFAGGPAYAAQDYYDVLSKIVHTVHLTDTNIKTILHHVHKLRARSPLMAQTVLVTLISQRLLGAEKPNWLEKAFVTMIWNCTTTTDFADVLSSLAGVLDTLASNSGQALSPSATHAAQIVRFV